jgi:hypothetical protein
VNDKAMRGRVIERDQRGALFHPVQSESEGKFAFVLTVKVGRGSSVGIATGYGLHAPGIESRWGRGFPHPSRSVLGPTLPPI